MASFDSKLVLKTALSKYKNAEAVKTDVLNVLTQFSDLTPSTEYFVFDDGTRKNLLNLAGTIPVQYKGITYNTPVCIWLMDTHPYTPPMVYVKPTSTMQIKAGKNVDCNGKIDLPYLREWRFKNHQCILKLHTNNIHKRAIPAKCKNQYLAGEIPQEAEERIVQQNSDIVFKWLQRLKYQNPEATRKDVFNAHAHFGDLLPKPDPFVFTDGTRKYLLQLDGTIPVQIKGSTYNMPICIWLMDTHPFDPPVVHVKPISSMQILQGTIVDSNGKIDLPYLRDWRFPNSDLVEMIQILTEVFITGSTQ